MENIALEKFNGFNFHTWKVKIQLQMMHKNLWGIVKGTEKAPTDRAKRKERIEPSPFLDCLLQILNYI